MKRAHVAVLTLGTLTLGFALVGCGAETPEDASSTPPLVTTPTPSDAAASLDASDEPSSESDAGACYLGDWVLQGGAIQQWYTDFMGDAATVDAASGEAVLSFTPEGYVYSTSGIELALSVSGQTSTALMTGGVSGTYTDLGDASLVMHPEVSDLVVVVEVMGISVTAEEMGIDIAGMSAFTGYTCTSSGLEMLTQSAGAGIATMVFTPAG